MPRIMNRLGWSISGAVALALLAALAGVIYAGPLDPPKPPAPTQANLIYQPAGCAGFPIVLAANSSYALAEDILMPAACGKNGIELSGDNITLDLAGFRVSGGGFLSGSLDGIKNTGGCGDCEVKNGIVRSWGGNAINMAGSNNARIHDVTSSSNGAAGIILGSVTQLSDCSVVSSGQVVPSDGIDGATSGLGDAISNCESHGNTRHGISLGNRSTLSDCLVTLNTRLGVVILGSNSVVERCDVSNNTEQGIKSTGSNNKIARNHAADNATAVGTCADIWADGPRTMVEDNTAVGTAPFHCPFFISGPGSVLYGNTASNGVLFGDFVNACGCDFGTVSTAAVATNPRGNVGD